MNVEATLVQDLRDRNRIGAGDTRQKEAEYAGKEAGRGSQSLRFIRSKTLTGARSKRGLAGVLRPAAEMHLKQFRVRLTQGRECIAPNNFLWLLLFELSQRFRFPRPWTTSPRVQDRELTYLTRKSFNLTANVTHLWLK